MILKTCPPTCAMRTSAHRLLATRFGEDQRVPSLCFRSWALWYLGYPEAALADAHNAIRYAREVGQAAALMFALCYATLTEVFCGNYVSANALYDELDRLADQKGAPFWKAFGASHKGCLSALSGEAAKAVSTIKSGLVAHRSTGATFFEPFYLSSLARAHAVLNQFDEAWRCIDEAMTATELTGERWSEAEVYRIAGELALLSSEPDLARAEAYFERALAVARQQQAKSWELRASMSLARLWRGQGKVQQARELLAPVYGWFTEGFDMRDLKEAKALLEELAVNNGLLTSRTAHLQPGFSFSYDDFSLPGTR